MAMPLKSPIARIPSVLWAFVRSGSYIKAQVQLPSCAEILCSRYLHDMIVSGVLLEDIIAIGSKPRTYLRFHDNYLYFEILIAVYALCLNMYH